ncbi:ent-kaurenoic acid oxidase 2-like [Cornus florida]|uniref:ent-kaurenoic acid oxidase 2-like n=1 Tax=Cornus florida TaxID=4283 RepID=UPI00289D42FD|nr:ent-kaurenoic acid oxidase 2-like [Cornus florida]
MYMYMTESLSKTQFVWLSRLLSQDQFPMELVGFIWVVLVAIFGGLLALRWLLKSVNVWFYETYKLGDKRFSLPPGDLGWPFIGNMWSFLRAFKSTDPDSFMSSFVTRFGRTGIYKAFMFGNPSVIVTLPETCRRVLTDDENFKTGWPTSTLELIGKKSFIGISDEEHRRLRRLTASPVNGPEALSIYIRYIEDNVISALDKWTGMGQFEFLTELRKLTFKIIMYIFLSSESEQVMEALEREYTTLNYGVRALAINVPGFAYHKARKARKKLVAIFQTIVDERRAQMKNCPPTSKKDMMDALLDVEDENGRRLNDEEIIDVLVMYLNAGHESSGHITMWATLLLQAHPEFFQKAKSEQELIVRNRPPTQEGLTLKEVKQMNYLSKVIDETLRLITFSLTVFREAKADVNINGYTIPKGWKVLVWFRTVHLDSETYPEPEEFNPSRWDGFTPKAGTHLPFGLGSHMCPGNDLAKLEIAIFLHYFLLNYELEQTNPGCRMMYLPHSRPKDNCLAKIRRVSP